MISALRRTGRIAGRARRCSRRPCGAALALRYSARSPSRIRCARRDCRSPCTSSRSRGAEPWAAGCTSAGAGVASGRSAHPVPHRDRVRPVDHGRGPGGLRAAVADPAGAPRRALLRDAVPASERRRRPRGALLWRRARLRRAGEARSRRHAASAALDRSLGAAVGLHDGWTVHPDGRSTGSRPARRPRLPPDPFPASLALAPCRRPPAGTMTRRWRTIRFPRHA